MLSITALEVINIGRTPGGDRFTHFVDSLIRSHCHIYSIQDSSVSTNLRTNKPDGGVDTRVDGHIQNDPTGWMQEKTIWQYKATEEKNISKKALLSELKGEYVQQCLKDGYAYRFCICDELAGPTRTNWEKVLTDEVRRINPDAPGAKVLTAGDLAAWANRYPPLLLSHFHLPLSDKLLHFEAWRKNITDLTEIYVPITAWEQATTDIQQHVDFSKRPSEVAVPIQGLAGVGKTRMVFEALAALPGSTSLVVYIVGDESMEICRGLANNPILHAVVVVDECSLNLGMLLINALTGHRERVRVITIDNSGERSLTPDREHWLEVMPIPQLDQVLQLNFPFVPQDRRRAYSNMSEGYVRLAANLCKDDPMIAVTGTSMIPSNEGHYRSRLSEEQREIIEALALVKKVGFSEDLAYELDILCNFLNVDKQRFKKIANNLHNNPGYIARTNKNYYVTPHIIAHIAFNKGWHRYAEPDRKTFLTNLPEQFIDEFRARVAMFASEEVKSFVGDFFRSEALEFRPGDLADSGKVHRFISLVEIEPTTYAPMLRRVVEQASIEQLQADRNDHPGKWEPRRYLIWLAGRLSPFSEYFYEAEKILLAFALAENEPHIGNNATNTWKELFRITLSGTSEPFPQRLALLEKRLFSEREAVTRLALDAIEGLLHNKTFKTLGNAVIAGRIPPAPWEPKNPEDYGECLRQVLCLLKRSVHELAPAHVRRSIAVALQHTILLLRWGLLHDLQEILDEQTLTDEDISRLVNSIRHFLHRQENTERVRLNAAYLQEVKQWLEVLGTGDFHRRLVTTIGVDPWDHARTQDEEKWKQEVQELAQALYDNRALFEQERDWLFSLEARSTGMIGEGLGKLDRNADLISDIFDASVKTQMFNLAKAYLWFLLDAYPEHTERANALLDEVEEKDAVAAFELFRAGEAKTRALERTLRLIDAERLSAIYLQSFLYGGIPEAMSDEDFLRVLNALVFVDRPEQKKTIPIAVQFVFYRFDKGKNIELTIRPDSTLVGIIWKIAEMGANIVGGNDVYWWAQLLERLIPLDPIQVARIASDAAVQQQYSVRNEALNLLMKVGKCYPEPVLEQLGRLMFQPETEWHFFIDDFSGVFLSLPEDLVMYWIENHGEEAARHIARHLASPRLDETLEPVVPRLTEFVLTRYEEDDRTFAEFLAGRHNGEISGTHQHEIYIAEKFLTHPLRRVREWAEAEIQYAKSMDSWLQKHEEEMYFEHKV